MGSSLKVVLVHNQSIQAVRARLEHVEEKWNLAIQTPSTSKSCPPPSQDLCKILMILSCELLIEMEYYSSTPAGARGACLIYLAEKAKAPRRYTFQSVPEQSRWKHDRAWQFLFATR